MNRIRFSFCLWAVTACIASNAIAAGNFDGKKIEAVKKCMAEPSMAQKANRESECRARIAVTSIQRQAGSCGATGDKCGIVDAVPMAAEEPEASSKTGAPKMPSQPKTAPHSSTRGY